MTLELLLAEFDGLIQTPADVEKLNATILQWAVQGRLVPQCEDDEPASQLFGRIQRKKQELLQTGEVKENKSLPKIKFKEIPYQIPNSWSWVYLDDVSEIIMGQSPPGKTYNEDGIGTPLVNGPVEFSSPPFGKTVKSKFTTAPTKMCREGDLILCVRGSTTGRTNVAGFDACIGRGVAAIRAYFYQDYLNLFILSHRQKIYDRGTGSTFPSVSYNKIRSIIYPLPPLAEQKRIVARVDELLGQTAVLTQQLASVHEQRRGVHTAVLHQLTTKTSEVSSERSSPTSEVSALTHNFDRFYVDADTVAELKQAILQLAVQGRLVPQDEQDEDAAVILELRDIVEIGGGGTPSKRKSEYWDGDIPWFSPKDMKSWDLFEATDTITATAIENTAVKLWPVGTVLIVVRGMILLHTVPVAVLKVPATVNQDMKALLPDKRVKPEFLRLALWGLQPHLLSLIERSTHGTCKLQTHKLLNVKICIPSCNEQTRILKKVDELFALCDQLAGQLTTTAASRTQLLEAVLAQA